VTHDPLRAVPVAPGRLPLVGHALALWRSPLRFVEALRTAGGIVRVDLGSWPVYVLTTPALVREALTTRAASLARGRIYDRARALFGDGLATSEGALHRRQRRLMQPAFQHRRIVGYADIMSRHACELAETWRPGQRVAVDHAMHELTLRIVVSALFAAELGRAAAAEVQRLMPVIMKGIAVRMVTPRRLDGWPIPVNRRFDAAGRRLRQVVEDVVAAYDADGRAGDDLLSLLRSARDAESGATMTDAQVCDEVISLLMAGTETPGNTLAWTFYELAGHPEVERRLHAEIDAVVGDGPVDFDAVAKLSYTARVLNEVLRLHPVLLFTRRVTAETELAGVRFPPGTEIAYSPYALHRDPTLYPAPARFDPDRWLPERAAHLPPRTFAPFGSGHHKCLGDAFAWTEMNIVVATIASRWRLRLADGHVVREVVAEVPRPDALPMVVEPRRR
jgi:cytochrome P450